MIRDESAGCARRANSGEQGAFSSMLMLLLCFGIVLADQAVKYLIRVVLPLGASVPVIDNFFNITHVRNPGAAWGVLGGFNTWLTFLSIAMLILLVIFRRAFIGGVNLSRWALGCMLGGIVGNMIDRIRLTFVVDFLDFHFGSHHFPAFNIADSAICVGVGLYMLAMFVKPAEGGAAGAALRA